jgi:hypothetical protein
MRAIMQICLMTLVLFSCTNNHKTEKKNNSVAQNHLVTEETTLVSEKERVDSVEATAAIFDLDSAVYFLKAQKGYNDVDMSNYLSDRFLIAQQRDLKGFKSLHIEGHGYYELDGRGNIIGHSDITNNHQKYFYDRRDRLVRAEYWQHSPPECYTKREYFYSRGNQLRKLIERRYKDSVEIETKVITQDSILIENGNFFKEKKDIDYLISSDRKEVVFFDADMGFCCGEWMKGNNQITYYLAEENGRIDSLVINGIESGDKMKFDYVYE